MKKKKKKKIRSNIYRRVPQVGLFRVKRKKEWWNNGRTGDAKLANTTGSFGKQSPKNIYTTITDRCASIGRWQYGNFILKFPIQIKHISFLKRIWCSDHLALSGSRTEEPFNDLLLLCFKHATFFVCFQKYNRCFILSWEQIEPTKK